MHKTLKLQIAFTYINCFGIKQLIEFIELNHWTNLTAWNGQAKALWNLYIDENVSELGRGSWLHSFGEIPL